MRDIRALASDEFEGRATGSPGGEKAAAYIETELRAAGLAPVREPFEFTAGVAIGPETALALRFAGTRRELARETEFLPLGFSANGEARAPLVFAGYGITAPEARYDDYATVDVRGKVALVLEGVPRAKDPHSPLHPGAARYAQSRWKAMNAREHGAAALLLVAEEKNAPLPLHAGVAGDAGILAASLARGPANEALAAVGRSLGALEGLIERELAPHSIELGPGEAELRVDLVREKRQAANVLAVLEGADPKLKDETIVIGAHYDHLGHGEIEGSLDAHPGKEIHHGADDNASGVAALLECARALMPGPPRGGVTPREAPFRRTVLFAFFSGEELGLLGSAHYVKEPARPLAATIAMINMDMVGRMRGKKITVGGAGTAEEWPPLVRKTAQDLGLEVALDEEGYGPSDHSSFYGKGVPVLFLFTGAHADYHKPGDTAEKINEEGEGLATKLALRLARAIDALDARPAWKKTRGTPHGADLEPGRGPTAYLGTIPDYADTEKPGVRLAGVREESPAERAGLRAGDLIVRFDGKEIRDVQDYTYALFAKKPGDKVEIVVERGAERVTLEAVIGRKGAK